MQKIREGCEKAGRPRHAGKAVSGKWEAEFWGGSFNGKTGVIGSIILRGLRPLPS